MESFCFNLSVLVSLGNVQDWPIDHPSFGNHNGKALRIPRRAYAVFGARNRAHSSQRPKVRTCEGRGGKGAPGTRLPVG